MRVSGWTALLLSLMVALCGSCSHNRSDQPAKSERSGTVEKTGGLYSRYNLHYYSLKGSNHASYANYTDCPEHGLLPYNTQFRVESWRGGFKFTAVETGLQIYFEYKSANMGGMRATDYLDLILSPAPVSYAGLTPEDLEGIKAGKALAGMTKQGVMVALGYPAQHRTPSLEANTWVYWKGRPNTLDVNFGEDGKVASIKE